jgi:hypothetical protein
MTLQTLLWIAAFLMCLVAAFWSPARVGLGWLGVATFILGWLIGGNISVGAG